MKQGVFLWWVKWRRREAIASVVEQDRR